MENKVKQILVGARDLLKDRARWTKGTLARDNRTWNVDPESKTAESWCSIGAMRKVAYDQKIPNECEKKAILLLSKALRTRSIAIWNDRPDRRHSTILKGFDKAIALAGEE